MKSTGILLIAGCVFILNACAAGSQPTAANQDPLAGIVISSNENRARIPVKGFAYTKARVPSAEWDSWAKEAAPVVRRILNSLPAGYVLQITGHADGRGPEEPEGKKPGNIRISHDWARAVFDSLKKNGINSPKLTVKGVGSAEPTGDCDVQDACQRRVSFKVVPR